ncbi:putative ribonuclease H-like domain-containing protein [Tanacetum coccineum]
MVPLVSTFLPPKTAKRNSLSARGKRTEPLTHMLEVSHLDVNQKFLMSLPSSGPIQREGQGPYPTHNGDCYDTQIHLYGEPRGHEEISSIHCLFFLRPGSELNFLLLASILYASFPIHKVHYRLRIASLRRSAMFLARAYASCTLERTVIVIYPASRAWVGQILSGTAWASAGDSTERGPALTACIDPSCSSPMHSFYYLRLVVREGPHAFQVTYYGCNPVGAPLLRPRTAPPALIGRSLEYSRVQEEPKALVTLDGEGVDCTDHAENKQENFALMAYSNSCSNTEDNPQRALKNKGIVDSGYSRHMTGNKAYLAEYQDYNGGTVAFGGSKGYITGKVVTEEQACLIAKAIIDESNKWHRRLGHVNFKNLNKLVKGNLVRGLPLKIFQNDHTCVACQKGKQHKASCKAKSVSSISQPLQLLHMDLFGPTSIRSINHKTYCLVITDDFSRFSWVFFLRTKDETSGILKDFIRQIENQLNQKVKTIRCDNGTEFKNRDIIEFCGSKGIKREYSNARTPQQNGVAKRKNTTLIEAARTMLADSFLPNTFWAEAVSTACYVLNRPVRSENQANKTVGPKEANLSAGTQDNIDAGNFEMEADSVQDYFVLPIWSSYTSTVKSLEAKNEGEKPNKNTEFAQDTEDLLLQAGAARGQDTKPATNDSQIPALEDIYDNPNDGIFTNASYDDEGAVTDFTNLETIMNVSPIPTSRIHFIHPSNQILGDPKSALQTRSRVNKSSVVHAFEDLLNSRFRKIDLVILPYGKKKFGTKWIRQEERTYYDRGLLAPVARIEARLLLNPKAFANEEEADDVEIHLIDPYWRFITLTSYRPDIMFAVCACSRFQVTPKTSHLNVVKRIFRQVLWIQNQMLDYGLNFMNTKIYIDNESTICIVKNPVFHSKTKHIEIRHHFIRDAYEKKLIQVLKIHIDDNVGDLLTKDFDVRRMAIRIVLRDKMVVTSLCCPGKKLMTPGKDSAPRQKFVLLVTVTTNTATSKTVNSVKQIHAIVNDKEVVISESSVRNALLFYDEDGITCLTNDEIFENLALMGTGDHPPVTDSSSSHDTTQDSKDSLEDTNGSKGTQVQSFHDIPLSGDHTSEKAKGGLNLEELFVLCTNLSNMVLALETSKDAQATEILKLKDQIKKLKRKCKPSISYRKAWLKSVKRLSMKKRLGRKEYVSKQGRKNAKPKPTLDAFDDLDADGRDYMETKDVVKEGRQSNETEELNKGSGDKGGSTEELVSTAVPKIMKEEKAKEKGVSIKDVEDSSRLARSTLTLKPLPIIDPKDKGKIQLQVDLQAEVERERQREEEASKAVINETYDEVQAGIDADALFAAKLQQAAQRSAEIRSRPPLNLTENFNDDISEKMDVTNLSLKGKTFAEIQGFYERPKKRVKQEGHEESIKKRPGKRLKMKETKKSKRQKTDADIEEEEQLKAFIKIVPDEEEIINYEVLEKRSDRFETTTPEGVDLVLWGDLRTMFDANAEDELWQNQERWNLKSWDFYENCGVHTLILEDGTEIHMLAERKYPLTKETLEKMMSLKLVAESASDGAYNLLRSIQKQIDESGSYDGSEKDL